MLIKIRKSIFETNSSSCHTMIICTKKEFEGFKTEEYYINTYEEKLIHINELKNKYSEYKKECENKNLEIESFDEWIEGEEYKTHEQYNEDSYLEYFEVEYTTESGDEIVIFGEHGMDN